MKALFCEPNSKIGSDITGYFEIVGKRRLWVMDIKENLSLNSQTDSALAFRCEHCGRQVNVHLDVNIVGSRYTCILGLNIFQHLIHSDLCMTTILTVK